MKLPQKLERRSRLFWMVVSLGFLALVGEIDYWTGFEIYFSVFYLLGIGLATWFVGKRYGLCLSVLSVVVWILGDLAAGAHYSSPFIPIWNSTILLTFYGIVVWLLASLHSIQKDLENRVRQRTQALTEEMAERERLEKELLEVSEREQRRIGRDLHDSLCQHLTGTALAGQVLRAGDEAGDHRLISHPKSAFCQTPGQTALSPDARAQVDDAVRLAAIALHERFGSLGEKDDYKKHFKNEVELRTLGSHTRSLYDIRKKLPGAPLPSGRGTAP
jgi:hypothetical protein